MSRPPLLPAVLCALCAAAAFAASPVGAAGASRYTVSVSRAQISTDLGHRFSFRTTVVNHASTTARGLIAHLNIVGLDASVYVDPEDWSAHRTRYLDPVPAGGSATITWRLQAVSAGKFDVYVAVLPRRETTLPPTTGPAVRVGVADRRTLNSGGILPLALGVPGALGLLALTIRFRRSR